MQTVEPLAIARGLEVELREELGEEQQWSDLPRSLADQNVALCVHGGLSDAVCGERQKKGETIVVDENLEVVERIRV